MSDPREALARLVRTLDARSAEDQERLGRYWDRGLADGDVQEDVYRRTDAILAEFDVVPRGSSEQPGVYLCANPDAPDHPPHGIPLYIESWGTCDARPAPVVLNSPHGLGCLPGCGHDRSEAAVPDSEHDHEWQRRQNITSSGYRLPPYEVCAVAGCGAARQVDEPATCDHGGTLTRRFDGGRGAMTCDLCDEIVGYWTPPGERVKPTVEDVARAILMVTQAADVDPDYAWNVQYPEVQDELLDQARAVLALFEKGEGRG